MNTPTKKCMLVKVKKEPNVTQNDNRIRIIDFLGSVFNPISTVAAQASDPAYLSFDPVRMHNQEILPMSVGGPDAFGYTYDDTVSYSWVTASTNTTLTGDDATSGAMNIGFNFPFYESNYSQLLIPMEVSLLAVALQTLVVFPYLLQMSLTTLSLHFGMIL